MEDNKKTQLLSPKDDKQEDGRPKPLITNDDEDNNGLAFSPKQPQQRGRITVMQKDLKK